jgi:pimeloyl-ACP methyl ester carboxylesterase
MQSTERQILANGLSFETFECGVGDRLALCLHGFPSHAICWDAQLPMLAKLGYRAWSPNQRGYGRSSRPRGVAAYAIDRLLEDIAAIIDASAAKSTVLIGHDWGGLLARRSPSAAGGSCARAGTSRHSRSRSFRMPACDSIERGW